MNLFEFKEIYVSTKELSEVRSHDRNSVISQTFGAPNEGDMIGILEKGTERDSEDMKHHELCIITSVEQDKRIAKGYCILHFSRVGQVMPNAMYKKLSALFIQNEEMKKKLINMADSKIEGVAA